MNRMNDLKTVDPEVAGAIIGETDRQERGAQMIASENFVSRAIMQAVGSSPMNKYSEGYPGKRYYGGNKFIDIIERAAIKRVKKLFDAPHANVQPHSGSSANRQAYGAMLQPGDTILGLSLDAGGHLTHGHKANFSGVTYNIVAYGINPDTERIDMDEVQRLAEEHKPKLVLSGFSAYSRSLDFKLFREIADSVQAYHMADIAHIAGLCATGVHENPMQYCDIVTTTTHKTLRGPHGGVVLSQMEDRLQDKYWPDSKKTLADRVDSEVFPKEQGGPLDNMIAGKAVAFKEALQPDFTEYAQQIVKNAQALAKTLMDGGS